MPITFFYSKECPVYFLKVSIEFVTTLLLFYASDFFAARHVGSQLSDQRSNPHPLHWKVKS